MKKGDKVKTIYGQIETIMTASKSQVVTYESARRLSWYHPTKVWKVNRQGDNNDQHARN